MIGNRRAIEHAVDQSIARYADNVRSLIQRSEERVDRVNKMVLDLIEADRLHTETARDAAEVFRIASETFSREIAQMRVHREEQTKTIHALQEELQKAQSEIDRLIEVNRDIVSAHQTLVANLTKLNINVRS